MSSNFEWLQKIIIKHMLKISAVYVMWNPECNLFILTLCSKFRRTIMDPAKAKIISVKNAQAWVSMVSYFKK